MFFISIYNSVEGAEEELWQYVRKFARKSQHNTRDTRIFFFRVNISRIFHILKPFYNRLKNMRII